MHVIFRRLKELDFAQLMLVYEEGNQNNGKKKYPHLSEDEQIKRVEMDLYDYLQQDFFRKENAFYGVLILENQYVCALRMEPYLDGFLLEALETRPHFRNCGYATQLLKSVLAEMGDVRVYSHVKSHNFASLNVHKKCGFIEIKDYARYLDGSVSANAVTLCYQK